LNVVAHWFSRQGLGGWCYRPLLAEEVEFLKCPQASVHTPAGGFSTAAPFTEVHPQPLTPKYGARNSHPRAEQCGVVLTGAVHAPNSKGQRTLGTSAWSSEKVTAGRGQARVPAGTQQNDAGDRAPSPPARWGTAVQTVRHRAIEETDGCGAPHEAHGTLGECAQCNTEAAQIHETGGCSGTHCHDCGHMNFAVRHVPRSIPPPPKTQG
jgi:hypothetical protein